MGDDALIDQVRTKKGDIPFCTRTEGTGADGRQQFEAYVDGSIHIHPLTFFSFYEQILGSGMCICPSLPAVSLTQRLCCTLHCNNLIY